MKKLSLMLAAALALSLWSCDEKEENISEIPPTENITSEEIADTPFRELSDEDFTDINVNVSKQEGTSKLKTTLYDVSDMQFGEKLSPCMAEDVREVFIEAEEGIYGEMSDRQREVMRESKREICEHPSNGKIVCMTSFGNTVYAAVSYDELCSYYSHCVEIWSYSLTDGGMQIKYMYSSTEKGINVLDMTYADGALWLMMDTGQINADGLTEDGSWIMRIDDTTGEAETVYEGGEYPGILHPVGETPMYYTSERIDDENLEWVIKEYDGGSGEMREVYRCESGNAPLYNGSEFAYSEKNENGCCDVVGSNFRLSTGLRGRASMIYSGNQISFLINSDKTRLYTYDLDKMERYISDVSGYGTNAESLAGRILLSGSSDSYLNCFIPELGLLETVYSAEITKKNGLYLDNSGIRKYRGSGAILILEESPESGSRSYGFDSEGNVTEFSMMPYEYEQLYVISPE